jgi:CO/xanthine dehydrogenase FAD-binding subunit
VSLRGIPELRGIEVTDREIIVGALTTYTEVIRSEVLQAECPLLGLAAAETGGVATQNRGTIGGNIANASPAADTPPALLVYDAVLDLVSARGSRRVPYDRFHLGYKHMDLAPDEIVQSIRLTRGRGGWLQTWRKIGTRRAQAISKLSLAAAIDVRQSIVHDIRLALGSVAPTVVRASRAEASIRGRAIDAETIEACRAALSRDIAPIDDLRSTAQYRLRVAGNLVEEFLSSAVRS